MPTPSIKNRVGAAVTGTPGTGTVTLAAAEPGYQSFATAYAANANIDILIEEGNAWEIARDCTYTNTGTTVTRGTLEASSTGSAVSFTSAAKVYVIESATRIQRVLTGYKEAVSVTAATTLTTSAIGKLHICSGTTADYTVTLPTAASCANEHISFAMASGLTKMVTLDANGTETIDGQLVRIMWANETAVLYSDGTTWVKVAGKSLPMSAALMPTTGTTTSITNATNTKITLNTLLSESVSGMGDTTNSRIYVKRPGIYAIDSLVSYERIGTAVAGAESYNFITKNTATTTLQDPSLISVVPTSVSGGNTYAHVALSGIIDLVAGDYLGLAGHQTTGGTCTTRDPAVVRPHLRIVEVPTW